MSTRRRAVFVFRAIARQGEHPSGKISVAARSAFFASANFPVTCSRPRFSPLRRSVTIPPAFRTASFSRSLASLFSALMAAADNPLLAFFSPPSVPFQRFCSCSGHCVPSVEALAELRATRAYPDQGCRPVTDAHIYICVSSLSSAAWFRMRVPACVSPVSPSLTRGERSVREPSVPDGDRARSARSATD